MTRKRIGFLSLFPVLLLLLCTAVSCDSDPHDPGPDPTSTVGPLAVPIAGGGIQQSENYRTSVSVGHVGTVTTGSQRYKTSLMVGALTRGTR